MNHIQWQSPDGFHADLAQSQLKDWLYDSGSFMQRLKIHGIEDAKIEVLSQNWQFPTPDEKYELNLPDRTYVLAREVYIKNDEQVLMFARTIFPRQTLTGAEKQFRQLKSQSLGSKLFTEPSMMRTPFEFAFISAGSRWYEKAVQCLAQPIASLWGRRSIFFIKEKPLLLTEIYLPDMAKLSCK